MDFPYRREVIFGLFDCLINLIGHVSNRLLFSLDCLKRQVCQVLITFEKGSQKDFPNDESVSLDSFNFLEICLGTCLTDVECDLKSIKQIELIEI